MCIVWQYLSVAAPSSVICFSTNHCSSVNTAVSLNCDFFQFPTLVRSLLGKGFVVIFPGSLPPTSDSQNDLIEPINFQIQVHIRIYANVFEKGPITFKHAAFIV